MVRTGRIHGDVVRSGWTPRRLVAGRIRIGERRTLSRIRGLSRSQTAGGVGLYAEAGERRWSHRPDDAGDRSIRRHRRQDANELRPDRLYVDCDARRPRRGLERMLPQTRAAPGEAVMIPRGVASVVTLGADVIVS